MNLLRSALFLGLATACGPQRLYLEVVQYDCHFIGGERWEAQTGVQGGPFPVVAYFIDSTGYASGGVPDWEGDRVVVRGVSDPDSYDCTVFVWQPADQESL